LRAPYRLRTKVLLIPLCFVVQRGPETLYRILSFVRGDVRSLT
jgi:hypothetical protein